MHTFKGGLRIWGQISYSLLGRECIKKVHINVNEFIVRKL